MITRYIVEIETARIGDEFSADWIQDVIEANLENDTTQRVNVNLVKVPSEEDVKQYAEIIKDECNNSYESGLCEGRRVVEKQFKEYL